ncbi:MAG: peptidoglycan-binding domain-containing protein [Patescibacteria group bacterium]
MATIYMAVKITPKKMRKSRLLALTAIAIFFVFPLFVSAISYGDRGYNLGLYSANTPSGGSSSDSHTVTCASNELFNPTTGICTSILAVTPAGCTATTLFSPIDGQRCPTATTLTKTTSYNFGPVTLKVGSVGNAVKELQRFFNNTLNINLVVDGKLGKKTIAAVKKWQKDNGLAVDGLVGPKTKAKMNATVK